MLHSESLPFYTGFSELYLEPKGKKNLLFVKEGNIARDFRALIPKAVHSCVWIPSPQFGCFGLWNKLLNIYKFQFLHLWNNKSIFDTMIHALRWCTKVWVNHRKKDWLLFKSLIRIGIRSQRGMGREILGATVSLEIWVHIKYLSEKMPQERLKKLVI